MGLIQDIVRKLKEKKAMKQDYEFQQQIIEGYETKKIMPEERDLMRYQEEARRERIKKLWRKIKLQKDREFWSGHLRNAVDADNIIKNQPNIFKPQGSLLQNNDGFLKQKISMLKTPNITAGCKNIFKCK